MTAEQYAAALDAEREQAETDIALLPAVIDRKLALYGTCQRIAMENNDLHGANNWALAGLMAQAVRDMRAPA